VLLSLAEMPSIMLLDVSTALLATTPLFLIAIPQPARKLNGDGEKASFSAELREGLRYLLNWRGLAMITLGAMIFKIALTPVFSLLPLLVTDHFDGEAGDLATLESAFGIGIILGGLLLGVCGGFRREGYFGLSSILIQAPILITLGLLPSDRFPIAVGLLLIMGGTVATAEGLLFSMLQKNVAPDMQGRIFMLFGSLSGLATPIGLILAGPVADAISVQVWYIMAGILVGGFAIWGLLTPEMVDLKKGRISQPVPIPVEEALSAPHPAPQEVAGG
jgi:DHA3 family macrolide efflux protein-like MFS transporter